MCAFHDLEKTDIVYDTCEYYCAACGATIPFFTINGDSIDKKDINFCCHCGREFTGNVKNI